MNVDRSIVSICHDVKSNLDKSCMQKLIKIQNQHAKWSIDCQNDLQLSFVHLYCGIAYVTTWSYMYGYKLIKNATGISYSLNLSVIFYIYLFRLILFTSLEGKISKLGLRTYLTFSCIWDKDFRINFRCWKM